MAYLTEILNTPALETVGYISLLLAVIFAISSVINYYVFKNPKSAASVWLYRLRATAFLVAAIIGYGSNILKALSYPNPNAMYSSLAGSVLGALLFGLLFLSKWKE